MTSAYREIHEIISEKSLRGEIARLQTLTRELADSLEAIDGGLTRYIVTRPYSKLFELACRDQELERIRAEVRLALEKAREACPR